MLNSSDVLTAGIPKSTKFDASVPTVSLVKSIRQRKYMSALVLWNSSQPITLMKMDVESPSLAKFPSTEASKFWVLLMTLGHVDFRLLRTPKIPLCPLVGGMPIPPIRTGELSRGYFTSTSQLPEVVLSLPVCLTCLGVRIIRVFLHAASVMTYVVWGFVSLIWDAPEVATLLSIRG